MRFPKEHVQRFLPSNPTTKAVHRVYPTIQKEEKWWLDGRQLRTCWNSPNKRICSSQTGATKGSVWTPIDHKYDDGTKERAASDPGGTLSSNKLHPVATHSAHPPWLLTWKVETQTRAPETCETGCQSQEMSWSGHRERLLIGYFGRNANPGPRAAPNRNHRRTCGEMPRSF